MLEHEALNAQEANVPAGGTPVVPRPQAYASIGSLVTELRKGFTGSSTDLDGEGLPISNRNPIGISGVATHHTLPISLLNPATLGSGLIDQSQKMTVAARAMAEKKAVGQRS